MHPTDRLSLPCFIGPLPRPSQGMTVWHVCFIYVACVWHARGMSMPCEFIDWWLRTTSPQVEKCMCFLASETSSCIMIPCGCSLASEKDQAGTSSGTTNWGGFSEVAATECGGSARGIWGPLGEDFTNMPHARQAPSALSCLSSHALLCCKGGISHPVPKRFSISLRSSSFLELIPAW